MVIKIDTEYNFVVSPDFDPTIVPAGYIWDETAFKELVKATDKATADQTIYTYGGSQGGADVDYLNAADLTISDEKYNGEGQVVDTTVTANAFNNTGTVTTDGAIVFSVKSFTNFGEFDLDKTGSLTATSAVTNMADGTINLNAGSTLQGSTVVNAGTITVVSDHAAINGAITNNGIINATKRKLTVVGNVQNANEDDTAEARDNSVITAREFEVTGNVTNYGILGTEMQPDHEITISGELRNYRQIEVGILTAGSIYSDGYYPEIEEKCTRGYIIAGEVNAGSIDNVSGVIQTAAPKETAVGINVTGTINNGNADGIIAKINAGLNGWIQAASLNNIGTDIENESGIIIAGKITVGDVTNNGGISTRIVESTGTITNDAAGLFAVTYIDDPTVTGLVEGASLTAGTIINGGTFAVCSEAALPTEITVTSIENSGLFEFTGVGFTLTGDIFNKTEGQLDVAGTITGGTGSITNSGTLNISNADDVSGVLTIDGAVKNAKTGTINLNAGTTLQGTTIGNAGTITVVSDHAALNGAISNHSLIDSVMKTLNVTGDIQNANEDDMREARNSSIIKVRNLNVTGNVTNYGVIGTEWQEANDITISGDLRNFHQIIVNRTLTANSVYQDYIDSEIEEKRCVGYIICGQVIAGEINNASGEISAGADKDAGIAIEATGKITNGKADALFSATLQAGDDGCIQAVDALNNIGAASTVHAGYITVLKGTEAGDLTNDGIIQTKSITVDGSVTNSASGSIEIDGASTEPGNLSATSIGNAGTLNLNGNVTLACDVDNSNLLNFQGTVTATGAITNTETGAINIKSAGEISGSVAVTNSGTLHIAIQSGKENKITADKFYNTAGVGRITIGGSFAGGVASVITATEGDVKVSGITLSVTSADEKEVTAATRGGNVVIASGVDYSTIYLSNGIDEDAIGTVVQDSTGASYYVDFNAFKLPASALEDGVRDATATILIDGATASALKYESETTAAIDGLAFAKDGTNAATPEDEEKNVELVLTGMDPANPESYRDLKKGITVGAGVTLTVDKLRQTGKDAVTNINGELRAGTYNTDNQVIAVNAFEVAAGQVNVNGALYDCTVSTGGTVTVCDGGYAENVTMENGGNLEISLGGLVNGVTVASGGSLLVYNGAKLTGRMTFEVGAEIIPFVGSTLDFDLTQTEAGSAALVNDLSILLGTPSYTITVDGTQADGTYNLAGGASSFNKPITVVNTTGEELGTLTVGNTLIVGGAQYTLNLTGDALSVEIASKILPGWTFYNGDFNGYGPDMIAAQADGSSIVTVYWNGEPWGLGLTLEPGWNIAGTGDFDGDNLDDFLRVNTEGYVVGEMSNGNGTFSPQVLNFLSPGWGILGTGDFDGNGADDILIANPTAASETVGLLGYWKDGTEWTLINGYSAEWECVSTGDFDGDGKCDMLWKNSFIGDGGLTYNAYCTWIVDNPVDWRMVSVANPAEWNFLCSGDFDGNGSHDIAMINNEGVVGIWGVSDGYLSSWSILSAVDTSVWELAGVGDFNGDKTDDIAWRNMSTGLTGYWQINDKELTTWTNIATIS
ncbi:MAG: AIDA repeat-containing protein [Lentisphaeria bacterium]|nr:AIDA repeat-containing protein [Lentisphaeria bacterium]